jgi:hypothetical protein
MFLSAHRITQEEKSQREGKEQNATEDLMRSNEKLQIHRHAGRIPQVLRTANFFIIEKGWNEINPRYDLFSLEELRNLESLW